MDLNSATEETKQANESNNIITSVIQIIDNVGLIVTDIQDNKINGGYLSKTGYTYDIKNNKIMKNDVTTLNRGEPQDSETPNGLIAIFEAICLDCVCCFISHHVGEKLKFPFVKQEKKYILSAMKYWSRINSIRINEKCAERENKNDDHLYDIKKHRYIKHR